MTENRQNPQGIAHTYPNCNPFFRPKYNLIVRNRFCKVIISFLANGNKMDYNLRLETIWDYLLGS